MRYTDQKLLREYALLQLEITIARNPTTEMNCSPANVHRTVGYRKLRAFFLHLSPSKRDRYRRTLRSEIDGIRQVVAMAKAKGEPLSMADITISVLDDAGKPVEPLVLKADDGADSEPAE